jgi:hypothetical protein
MNIPPELVKLFATCWAYSTGEASNRMLTMIVFIAVGFWIQLRLLFFMQHEKSPNDCLVTLNTVDR